MYEIRGTLAFAHSCCLERLKKHAFLCCKVYAIARRLAKPCIKIAPVSTSCAMATTSPFLSYFNPSRNFFVSGVSGATSEAFVSASSSAFFAAAVHLPQRCVFGCCFATTQTPEAFASQFAFSAGPSPKNAGGKRNGRQKRRRHIFFFWPHSRSSISGDKKDGREHPYCGVLNVSLLFYPLYI